MTVNGNRPDAKGDVKITIPEVDDAPTATSSNPVKSSGIWSAIWGALTALPDGFVSIYDWCASQLGKKLDKTDVDAALSADSTNPVQNKAVKAALDTKQGKLVAGTNITIAEDGKTISASVTVDKVLSATSTNPVQNKVIASALNKKLEQGSIPNYILADDSPDSYEAFGGEYCKADAAAFRTSGRWHGGKFRGFALRDGVLKWIDFSGNTHMESLGGGNTEVWKGTIDSIDGVTDDMIGAKQLSGGNYPRLHARNKDIHGCTGFSNETGSYTGLELLLPWDVAMSNETSYLMAGVKFQADRGFGTQTFVQPLVPKETGSAQAFGFTYAIPAFEDSPVYWKGHFLYSNARQMHLPWDKIVDGGQGTLALASELDTKADQIIFPCGVSIGSEEAKGATSDGSQINIGQGSLAWGQNSIAIGPNAKAHAPANIVIGKDSCAITPYGADMVPVRDVIVGIENRVESADGIAIGAGHILTEEGEIAIGAGDNMAGDYEASKTAKANTLRVKGGVLTVGGKEMAKKSEAWQVGGTAERNTAVGAKLGGLRIDGSVENGTGKIQVFSYNGNTGDAAHYEKDKIRYIATSSGVDYKNLSATIPDIINTANGASTAYAPKSAERYDLATIADGQLLDRTINAIAPTADVTVVFPAQVEGKARDFALRITQGETAYSIDFPADVTYEGDEFPTMEAGANYLISFTETAANVFFMRVFELTAVTQAEEVAE